MPGLRAPSPPIVLRPHCMLADDATTFTVTRKGWWRRKYLRCKSSWTCGVGVEGGCITGRCDVTSQLLYWFSLLPEPFPSVPTHSISRIDCVKCWMTSCYWHRFFLASLESSDFCGGFSPKLRRSTWDDEKEKMRQRQMTKEIFQDVESWSAERMRMIDPIAHAQENFALRKDPLSTLAQMWLSKRVLVRLLIVRRHFAIVVVDPKVPTSPERLVWLEELLRSKVLKALHSDTFARGASNQSTPHTIAVGNSSRNKPHKSKKETEN